MSSAEAQNALPLAEGLLQLAASCKRPPCPGCDPRQENIMRGPPRVGEHLMRAAALLILLAEANSTCGTAAADAAADSSADAAADAAGADADAAHALPPASTHAAVAAADAAGAAADAADAHALPPASTHAADAASTDLALYDLRTTQQTRLPGGLVLGGLLYEQGNNINQAANISEPRPRYATSAADAADAHALPPASTHAADAASTDLYRVTSKQYHPDKDGHNVDLIKVMPIMRGNDVKQAVT